MLESDLIIIIITSTIGSLVRIAKEWNSHTITLSKAVLILLCSMALGYIISGCLTYLLINKEIDLFKYVGHFCIIGGIISLEVVDLFIEEIPNAIRKLVSKKINIDLDDK